MRSNARRLIVGGLVAAAAVVGSVGTASAEVQHPQSITVVTVATCVQYGGVAVWPPDTAPNGRCQGGGFNGYLVAPPG